MALPELLSDHEILRNGVASTVLVLGALALRSVALRSLRHSSLETATRLRWRVQVRNATIILILLGVVVVWAQELRSVAISVAAIAAALVLATKEFLMCLLGSTLRATGRSFSVGHRIEVVGVRGDVIDIGPVTTTVLEVGPGQSIHQHTGRRVTLPNSVFLTNPVTNESMSHEFVLHVLHVPLATGGDWRGARDRLLGIATARCQGYVEDARRALAEASSVGRGDTLIDTTPTVYLELPEPDRLELLLRFPAPARLRGRLAQQILREFLDDPPPGEPEPSDADAA